MKNSKRESGGKGVNKKPSKTVLAAILTAVVLSVSIIALLITNLFIPIKYISAYVVSGEVNKSGTTRVGYLNVGFGDCTVIELPDGKTALIDGGDGSYENNVNILKYLNSRSINKIDYLICSSVKSEHCGGLAEIVKYKSVGHAYIPYCVNTRITGGYHAFCSQLEEQNIPFSYACVGEGFSGNGYFFTFLSPTDYLSSNGEYAALNADADKETIENASVVTWLECSDTAFAFTSDIRAKGLKRIVEEYDFCVMQNLPFCPMGENSVKLEKCKILTAAGHGGDKNTYSLWYDFINPEQVIISVGEGYRGYPSGEALADISNSCTPRYTYDGDVTVTLNDGVYTIS